MEKSYVAIEHKVCPITGKVWETGALLLDKGLNKSLEKTTVTGNQVCPEAQEKLDAGYIALVVIDPSKSMVTEGTKIIKQEDAYRTGEIVYIRKHVAEKMFNIKVETIMFIDPETLALLQSIAESNDEPTMSN